MCVRALNGTVARWFLCVENDGEQAETVPVNHLARMMYVL
jgi:hypothetical protein